jgi:hypothetical protein
MRFSETSWRWRISTGPEPYQEWLETLDPPPSVDEVRGAVGLDRVRNAVIAEVNYRRAQTELRLRRLADLRNEIVHEGLAYRVDQRLFADAMGRITRDVVGKIVNAITSFSPRAIAEVQQQLDAPWM